MNGFFNFSKSSAGSCSNLDRDIEADDNPNSEENKHLLALLRVAPCTFVTSLSGLLRRLAKGKSHESVDSGQNVGLSETELD